MRRVVSLFVFAGLAACASDEELAPRASTTPPASWTPPPESCDPPVLGAVRTFQRCSLGSGAFGRWTLDEEGLPAYDYGLDENADARASFFNTEMLDRRDHRHELGNRRVTALATNDGYVEVTHQERGITFLNAFDPDHGNFAGGFSYVDDGQATWSTAYKWRPDDAIVSRRFGAGYVEATSERRGVRVARRTFAPAGDAPFVIDEVTITNTGASPEHLAHYEVWDVARRAIEINWAVSGSAIATAPEAARAARDARDEMFEETATWEPAIATLGLRRALAKGVSAPPREAPNAEDFYPADPFLTVLEGPATDLYTHQDDFFGMGGVAAPDAVSARRAGEGLAAGVKGGATAGKGQPRTFVVKSALDLDPGATRTLRFAYGYTPMGAAWPLSTALYDPTRDLAAEARKELRKHLFYFAKPDAPALQRELGWHAAMIEQSVAFRDYWGVHVVPQGSAYLYLHGADGAARDLSLFAMPLVYVDRALARDELALNMMITHAEDKRISYAFQGHGVLDDALDLHKAPSDLTIFLLAALVEYVGATGDTGFLDASMPYYPLETSPSATVWDHVVAAVRYLFDTTGTGAHGLIRLSTGDWSDGIAFEAPDLQTAIAKGESVPNTQMAVAVLPLVADLAATRDPALAKEIRDKVGAYRKAALATWTGASFGRAYFGDDKLAYAGTPNLESQVWALIGGVVADEAQRATLIATIQKELDDPCPYGATLLPNGQVWPAISGLLTWGYAESRPDLAWKHLAKNTMSAHAEAYPDVWYGIWSGPDGLNGPGTDRPGETWYSLVTPMTDFPVTNNNQHAMPLLAALRAAGVKPTARGLKLDARGVPFALSTELLDLTSEVGTLQGVYRPFAARTLDISAPPGRTIQSAKVAGQSVEVAPGATSLALVMPGGAQSFEVVLSR